MNDNGPKMPRYWGFISYSHADRGWADWLHKALEQYRIPRHLIGQAGGEGPIPNRIAPIFLDRVELAASPDLDAPIREALRASRSLIVICSPAALGSPRVANEIDLFARQKSGPILPLIVAGRPNAEQRGGHLLEECFPLPLRILKSPATGSPVFPLAADARPGKGGRREALLKIVAGILHINLDQLRQRDTQRRRVRWVAAMAICATSVVCASALAFYAWSQRDAAVKARDAAIQSQFRLLTQAAAQRLSDGDVRGARGIILAVLANQPLSNVPTAINVFQTVRATDRLKAILSGHTDFIRYAAFSPDGTRVVTASDDSTVRIWDAQTGIQVRVLSGHHGPVASAIYSPDGSRIVTASSDRTAQIWDASTGAQLATLWGHSDAVTFASYSPDGERIVTASDDKTARVWDARTGAALGVLAGHVDRVLSAEFSPDGKRIVTASWDMTARVWNSHSGTQIGVLAGHGNFVYTATYSPDGTQILTSSADKTARIWDAGNCKLITVLSGHSDFVESAMYSPDGTRIATASKDKTLRIWDAMTGLQLAVLSGQDERLLSARYSPDGTRIVSVAMDRVARILAVRTGTELGVLTGHNYAIGSSVYSPDGAHILTAGGTTLRVSDSHTGALLVTISGNGAYIAAADYSPDGSKIVSASYDRTARIWDARTGKQLGLLSGHEGDVLSANYSRDGTRIVSASHDKTARIWDAASGRQLAVLSGHVASIQWAVYSPDGRRIVTASQDKTTRLWDAQSGAQLAVLSGHDASLTSVAFSPDGIHIATASADKTARIWDIRTGEQRAVLSGHSGAVESVAYSPDGAHVVTASVDKTVRIWDSHDGRQLSLLQGHEDVVYMAAYSPNSKYVVSASQDKTAIVHDASVPADIGGQVAWYEAAESDPLTGVDRVELGLGPDPQVRAPSAAETDCDQAAAAWYDPDRASAGVVLESINIEAAAAACSREATSRAQYQLGRTLWAQHNAAAARLTFEAASAGGYRAARIDLADLLISQSTDVADLRRAISLYEKAWDSGVSIAAFRLGEIYEFGAHIPSIAGNPIPDSKKAWLWYQKGVDAGEPNALARAATREEAQALASKELPLRNALLLRAFGYYASATEGAYREDWPDNLWRHWRYRRATLARFLAHEGMMQQVADAYSQVHQRGVSTVSFH